MFFFSHTLRQQEKRSPSSPNISQTKDFHVTRQNVCTTGESHCDYTASQAHIQWYFLNHNYGEFKPQEYENYVTTVSDAGDSAKI